MKRYMIIIIAIILNFSYKIYSYNFEYNYNYYENYDIETESDFGNIKSHRVWHYGSTNPNHDDCYYNYEKHFAFQNNVVLSFSQRDVRLGNEYPAVKSIKVNWGDGSGWSNSQTYETYDPDNPEIKYFSHNYNIQGNTEEDTIRIKIKFYNLHGQITSYYEYVLAPIIIYKAPDKDFYNDYFDELCFFSANSSIKKPILIVEGFDPLNTTSMADYYHLNPTWIRNQLINRGYDVYMLNFHDAGRDMRDNAMSVLGALRFIANRYTLCEGIKLFGISMGGVISRYALAWAEENNIKHYTSMFISLDSPQRGAQLNSFLQSLANNFPVDNSDGLNFAEKLQISLESTAAKQLLRYNAFESYAPYSSGSEKFCEFFGELNEEENQNAIELYNLPITILNGDGYPHNQNNIVNLAVSNGKTTRSGNIDNNNDFIYINGEYEIEFLGFNNDGDFDGHILADGYDTQPGSTLGIEQGNIFSFSYSSLFGITEYNINGYCYYDPVFIPTISSLDLKGISITNTADFVIDGTTIYSKFDDFVTQDNLEHNATHSEVSSISTNAIQNWLRNKEYNKVNNIIGHINSDVTDNPSIGLVSLKLVETNEIIATTHPDENGDFCLPNPFIHDCHYDILFSNFEDFYPTKLSNIYVPYESQTDFLLPNLTLNDINKLNLNYIIVDPNANGNGFKTIFDALLYIYYYDSYLIDHGTQNTVSAKIILPQMTVNNLDFGTIILKKINLTLQGPQTNNPDLMFTIDGQNTSQVGLNLEYLILNKDISLKISNIRIKNCYNGIKIGCIQDEEPDPCFESDYYGEIILENCLIENNGQQNGEDEGHLPGAGITIFRPNVTIKNCTIKDNIARYHFHNNDDFVVDEKEQSHLGLGAGIYIWIKDYLYVYPDLSEPSIHINIFNNQITHNFGYEGNGIYLYGMGQYLDNSTNINIKNNKFIENGVCGGYLNGEEYGSDYTTISLNNYGQVDILNNVIKGLPEDFSYNDINIHLKYATPLLINNEYDYYEDYISVNVINNDFLHIRNHTSTSIISNSICIFHGNNRVYVTNNLFYDNEKVLNGNAQTSYNCLTNCDDTSGFSASNNNIFISPENLLIDNNYQPIWTSTQKSPLIDAGDPTITDFDDTRSDIGAIRAVGHNRYQLDLPNYNQDNGILWTCLPVLDTLYTQDLIAENLLYDLLYPVNSSPLKEVQYKIGHESQTSISQNGDSWDNINHPFQSVLGYKFIMKKDSNINPDGYTLDLNGFLANPNTEIHLYAGTDNWIGYFLKDSQKMEDAFGSEVMSHITSVKTQHWFWMKPEPANGDTTSIIKCNYTLNYGDMLIVTCDEDITFQWQNGTPMEPIIKPAPKHFTADEKADYTPVYVKVTKDTTKAEDAELGVFMDGVCVGAAVINDTIIDVPVYPIESSKGDEEIEFVIYYNGAKQKETIKKYYVYDRKQHRMVKKSLDLYSGEPYYFVSLTDENTQPPKPRELTITNYPNPFNPETTFRYSLPKDGKVSIIIYNLKGQKVKTLINGYYKSGHYTSVWNGKNDNGKSVSSGVYFYKLKTKDKTIIRKMMLLK